MPTWCVTSITSVQIPEGAKIIIPISLLNPSYQDQERLKALIEHYKSYNPTILLADGLHRFNGSEEQAQALGDEYLETHKEILSQVNVVRWNDWINERRDAFNRNYDLINQHCVKGSALYNRCLKSINSLKNKTNGTNAMDYLKEELAAILTMNGEYDFHIYAGRVSPAIAKLYELFNSEFNLPTYVHIAVSQVKNTDNPERTELPVYLRAMLQQMEAVVTSSEIALEQRVEFVSQMYNVFCSCPPLQERLAKEIPELELFKRPFSDPDDKEDDSSEQDINESTSSDDTVNIKPSL